MSDALPIWTCGFAPLKGEGSTPLESLTVGAKFALNCHGEIPVEWKPEGTLMARFAKKEEAYTLVVLKVEKLDGTSADFVVTGYKPGKHAPEYVRIVQGENGFEVATADGGEQAMQCLAAQTPDLILMDVVMPGKNGFQLARSINRDPLYANVPIIFCSSKDQETDKLWGMRQGAKDYITKPFNSEELVAKIRAQG